VIEIRANESRTFFLTNPCFFCFFAFFNYSTRWKDRDVGSGPPIFLLHGPRDAHSVREIPSSTGLERSAPESCRNVRVRVSEGTMGPHETNRDE